MRDLLSRLFLGKNGSDEDESPAVDPPASASDKKVVSEEATEVDDKQEGPAEQPIEMTRIEKVKQPSAEGSGPVSGEEYTWFDENSGSTKPLSPPGQDTLVKMLSATGTGRDVTAPSLQAVHCTHVGKERSRNEDSTFIFTADSGGQDPLIPFGLYIVADGMGGHYAGHEASRSVSWLVASTVLERIYVPMLESSMSSRSRSQEPVMEVMVDAVQTANQQIYNPEPDKDSGTTLTAGLLFGQRLFIAHVGDSRAYLLEDGELTLLTTDHSYVRRLIDAGQLTEEEAAVHPQRNMLYKAVGQGGDLEIDTFTRSLPDEGMLVLCSDGLWGLVRDGQLESVLTSRESLTTMAGQLIEMALQAGGHDNISVVLVDFVF